MATLVFGSLCNSVFGETGAISNSEPEYFINSEPAISVQSEPLERGYLIIDIDHV